MTHQQSRLIGRKELANAMGISKYTMLRWSKLKGFPNPLPNSGRTPIYDLEEVERWLRSETSELKRTEHKEV